MEKTFSHRHLEGVEQRSMIGDLKNRWPALFEQSEVNAEFLRITTKPLQSKFLSQIDRFSDKLIQNFQSKGGVKGQRIKRILAVTDASNKLSLYCGGRGEHLQLQECAAVHHTKKHLLQVEWRFTQKWKCNSPRTKTKWWAVCPCARTIHLVMITTFKPDCC